MLAGVVLTTFNFLDKTRSALDSFHYGSDHTPHRLVVVDNASGDGTREYLLSRGYEVIAVPEPCSQAAAINLGLRRLLADPGVTHLGWIHNDMRFFPGWLANLGQVFQRAPWIGKLSPWELTEPRDFTEEEVGRFMRLSAGYLRLGNAVPWIMPRGVVEEVGLHDEGYVGDCLYEDHDYNNRLLLAGYPVMITKASAVRHEQAGTRRHTHRPDWDERNKARYIGKWGSLHLRLPAPF